MSSTHQNIPQLEDPNLKHMMSDNGSLAPNNSEHVVLFIKNLERFCNEVAENKLFWTPEVIAFFGITDDQLKRDYEFARNDV